MNEKTVTEAVGFLQGAQTMNAARAEHETIVYLEIRFEKTVDVLSRPHMIELEFTASGKSKKVNLGFMACRTDEERGDCYLTYVTEAVLPPGKLRAVSDSYIEFEIHQRSQQAMYSRSEFFQSSRTRRAPEKNLLIRRKYHCLIQQDLLVAPNELELCVSGTAEANPDSVQQAISIRDDVTNLYR